MRCLHFSTYIANTMGVSPTLWAGTNTGQVCWCEICISYSLKIVFLQVLVFLLTITPVDKRKNDKITAVLAEEIQLKHRTPVIDIEVTTGHLSLVSFLPPRFPYSSYSSSSSCAGARYWGFASIRRPTLLPCPPQVQAGLPDSDKFSHHPALQGADHLRGAVQAVPAAAAEAVRQVQADCPPGDQGAQGQVSKPGVDLPSYRVVQVRYLYVLP